jgi:hypothetical protein
LRSIRHCDLQENFKALAPRFLSLMVSFDPQICPHLAMSEKKHGRDRHQIERLLALFCEQIFANNLAMK